MMRHEAIFYRGDTEYADVVGGRVTAALDAGHPVIFIGQAERGDLIRDLAGERHGDICFLDAASLGRNPSRTIPTITELVESYGGNPITVVGEPQWHNRSVAETTEVVRHEALVNLAFADRPCDLLCPYDAANLSGDVLQAAARTHPVLSIEGQSRESGSFADPELVWRSTGNLPDPPAHADTRPFDRARLGVVRELILDHAADYELPAEKARALALAASEVASNSVEHAGGRGTVRIWAEPDGVVCEISDEGRLLDALAGRRVPGGAHGRGLWLANQLCDLVQLNAHEAGTVVRLRVDR